MTSSTDYVVAAITALTAPRHKLVDALGHVGNAAGLYAVHGSNETWRRLGLGPAPDPRPLYVGKAERSLASRDLQTHFRDGCTGSSTVRRSLAALLREELELRPVPRNLKRPEANPTHFALDPEGDARLTAWMVGHLELAVWLKPATCPKLADIESAVIGRWVPPLNDRGNAGSPWIAMVRQARQQMAAQLRRQLPVR